MSNLTDFFPSGGGGLTPKFQEFNASGTFTPSQALIDAGGYIEVFLVAGGGGGNTGSNAVGGQGGEALIKKMYLTSTNNITITIGSGGNKSSGNPAPSGGNSTFNGSISGGIDVTAQGGKGGGANADLNQRPNHLSPSWPSGFASSNGAASAGNGVFGYGAGGGALFSNSSQAGAGNELNNSGHGGITSGESSTASNGSSGYCLIKWYE